MREFGSESEDGGVKILETFSVKTGGGDVAMLENYRRENFSSKPEKFGLGRWRPKTMLPL